MEALSLVRESEFIDAGLILNLIHNLPFDEASQQCWSVDYFLSIELPTFLEHFEEVKAARLVTLYVCKQLVHQYLPDSKCVNCTPCIADKMACDFHKKF